MAVPQRDREYFRRIGKVKAEPRPAPTSFREALATLDRLIGRYCAMFPGRQAGPNDEEFRAHEEIYARARRLGFYPR